MTKRVPMVEYLRLDGEPHLRGTVCTHCGAVHLGRRNGCSRCGGSAFEDRALATTGELRSFTVVHRSSPKIATPFISAVVDLDGGGVIKANLLGVEPHPKAIDPKLRVRLTTFVAGTDDEGTEAVAFAFEPTEGGRNV